jgi:hypothetical protein
MDAETRERFALAHRLGMTVAELNERVSVSELTGWRQYFKELNSGQ